MSLIKQPSQQRSRETQERILDAFEGLLSENFHEDITVRQIAEIAGITPATLYRRFENKDALLPVLYSRYEKKLKNWADNIWTPERLAQHRTVKDRTKHIVLQHVAFFRANTAMIRTLYLKTRASQNELAAETTIDRKQIYIDMFQPVWEMIPVKGNHPATIDGALLILILISTVMEKIIFGTQRLAKLTEIDDQDFANQLTEILAGHMLRDT